MPWRSQWMWIKAPETSDRYYSIPLVLTQQSKWSEVKCEEEAVRLTLGCMLLQSARTRPSQGSQCQQCCLILLSAHWFPQGRLWMPAAVCPSQDTESLEMSKPLQATIARTNRSHAGPKKRTRASFLKTCIGFMLKVHTCVPMPNWGQLPLHQSKSIVHMWICLISRPKP